MHEEMNASVPKVSIGETNDLVDIGKKSSSSILGANSSTSSAMTGGSAQGGISSIFSNIGNAISSAVSKVTSVAGNFFGNMTYMAGHFFGGAVGGIVSTSVTIATIGTVGVAGATGAGITSSSSDATSTVLSDSVINDDCNTSLANLGGAGGNVGSGFDITDPQICENCYVIYSAVTQWGLNDAQAYGVLANAKCESGVTPWRTQGDNWVNESQSYAHASDFTIRGGGVGLWQFTTDDMKKGLDTVADSLGTHWSVLDTQVVYLLSNECPDFSTLCRYKDEAASLDATMCTRWFCRYWERCGGVHANLSYTSDGGDPETPYYKRWHSAEQDANDVMLAVENYKTNYASSGDIDSRVTSILSAASTAESTGESIVINSAKKSCGAGVGIYDNSSIASAAISLAYATEPEAKDNNGTQLYQTVYNNIIGNDGYYMACERLVKCAVCWSGSDDNIKNYGNCDAVYSYLESNEGKTIWSKVGVIGSDIALEDCLPGDLIIITGAQRNKEHGHTMIYTGEEMIQSVFGDKADAGSNVVEASFEKYSPHCDVKTDRGLNGFTVFRCTNPMRSNVYTSAGGAVPTVGNISTTENSSNES